MGETPTRALQTISPSPDTLWIRPGGYARRRNAWNVGLTMRPFFDLQGPGNAGMSLLRRVKERSPDTGVIVVASRGSVARAVEAMRLGAYDFLTKPADFKSITLSLQRFLEHQTLVVENKELRARLDSTTTFEEIVHRSEVMRTVCDTINRQR